VRELSAGDTITIYENESKQRFDVLVTEIHPNHVVGLFSTNGRAFDEGSFPFDKYEFPSDKPEPVTR
jgi:hypothetical protein